MSIFNWLNHGNDPLCGILYGQAQYKKLVYDYIRRYNDHALHEWGGKDNYSQMASINNLHKIFRWLTFGGNYTFGVPYMYQQYKGIERNYYESFNNHRYYEFSSSEDYSCLLTIDNLHIIFKWLTFGHNGACGTHIMYLQYKGMDYNYYHSFNAHRYNEFGSLDDYSCSFPMSELHIIFRWLTFGNIGIYYDEAFLKESKRYNNRYLIYEKFYNDHLYHDESREIPLYCETSRLLGNYNFSNSDGDDEYNYMVYIFR